MSKEVFVVPSFAKQLVEGATQKKNRVKVTTGDLSIVRDFTDVRDVVRAYYALLHKGKSGEIYNVCSGRGASLKNVLSMIAERDLTEVPKGMRLDVYKNRMRMSGDGLGIQNILREFA